MPLDKNGKDLLLYKNNCKIFIETGSADGDGIECAIKAGFEKIFSIELNPDLHNKCKEKFKDYNNVNLYCGSSDILLKQIIENVDQPFLLWLDAHYSGGPYIGDLMHNYLPKELNSITNLVNKFKNSPILIDDMNFYIDDKSFCNNIENLLKQIKPDGNIKYEQSCNQEAKVLFLVVL